MDNIVQSAVFPKLSLCTKKRMYFRYNSFVDISLTKPYILLLKGGWLLANTYFNSLSIGKIKKYANINELIFKIKFSGYIKIIWKVKLLQQSDQILQEDILESKETVEHIIRLSFWEKLNTGMLFFEIHALDDSEIFNFQYITPQEPIRNIKLGIVITHFNRQIALLSAIQRLQKELLSDNNINSKVNVFVVDNSQNLSDIEGIEILKNVNVGGSGGFSKGLLYLKQKGFYTHCLFMDDDASCEIESIRRTLFYLAYVQNDNIAIAGAMLRDIEPNMQHENGGVFKGICYSVKCHYNLLRTKDILLNETEERIDYGAWWFFAFPLNKVKYLAFPYFVRGDDISFSLANRFDILTVNGICSWQSDFAYKSGPLQLYLDQRNHIMHFLHNLVIGGNQKLFLKTCLILFILSALTYQYESARACTFAIKDILKGPDFWRKNVNLKEIRNQFEKFIQTEKIQIIPRFLAKNAQKGKPYENKIVRIIRILSLNGHLIPGFLFKNKPVWQYKHYGVRLREVFLRKEAIFYTSIDDYKGVLLKHNKKIFFQYSWEHLLAVLKLLKNKKRLEKEYLETYSELTSEVFWYKQFN